MKYLNFTELRVKLGGRGRTTVYRDIEFGRLPKPIKLGGRLYWIESQVDDLLANPEAA
jgi:predicted DNA-binding transcriptional regulator AlpA